MESIVDGALAYLVIAASGTYLNACGVDILHANVQCGKGVNHIADLAANLLLNVGNVSAVLTDCEGQCRTVSADFLLTVAQDSHTGFARSRLRLRRCHRQCHRQYCH